MSNRTSYEALFHKTSSYSHLRVFGCLCYGTNLPQDDNFASRADSCLFFGYSNTQKGYKFQDLTSHKVFVSHDVQFYEHMYPFHAYVVPSLVFRSEIIPSMDVVTPAPLDSPSPYVSVAPNSSLIRRLCRTSRPPIWTQDYICSTLGNNDPSSHSIVNNISYSNFSNSYRVF